MCEENYIRILEKELVPAMGCTEPIAVAYCAAKAREVLGMIPEEIEIHASGNIIKNVKSVVVPNTGGLKGLPAAALVGVLYGDANSKLEVIAKVSKKQSKDLPMEMEKFVISVNPLESDHVLDMEIVVKTGKHKASVRIWDTHTNIVKIEKDGEILYENLTTIEENQDDLDYDILTVDGIYEFAKNVELSRVAPILERQIELNMAISKAGLEGDYGARIGQVIAQRGDEPRNQAKAAAAAASDARMGGCELPVVINSGSGNQGITTSIPVIVYANYYRKSHEELLRALLVSNLVTLHLKSGIGRLSAYCGAVSAGVGAGAGIAFLLTQDLRTIKHEIVNAISITSGIVCDGAKASCAAKIAMAVESGILGFEMFENGNQFYDGEGLVSKGVENTIHNISALGQEGMRQTDKTIIEIMTRQ